MLGAFYFHSRFTIHGFSKCLPFADGADFPLPLSSSHLALPFTIPGPSLESEICNLECCAPARQGQHHQPNKNKNRRPSTGRRSCCGKTSRYLFTCNSESGSYGLSPLALPGRFSGNLAVLLCQINNAVVLVNIHRRSGAGTKFSRSSGRSTQSSQSVPSFLFSCAVCPPVHKLSPFCIKRGVMPELSYHSHRVTKLAYTSLKLGKTRAKRRRITDSGIW